MSAFEINIQRFVERTKADADRVCRAIALELLTRIVLRSPVGNPELWKANQSAVRGRETFNLFVDALNAADAAAGSTRKPLRRKGQKALKTQFKFRAGQGYVGGAFRRNWIVSVGSPSNRVVPGVDPSGAQAIADAAAALAGFKAGPDIFIRNLLPYAQRLEFEGHSTQSPSGMVRITLLEFQQIVDQAVSTVRSPGD